MTGEKLGWFRLASHLHSPIQLVKRTTSSTDFVDWMVYLNEEPNRFNPLFMYIAQLTAELRRSWVTSAYAKNTKTEDFLIKFVDKKEVIKQKVQQSKKAWFSFLGMNKNKKKE